MKEKIKGSEALMRSLMREGVGLVFGYPGGSIMPTYDALYDYQDRIRHILVRHEQGATHSAQGFARVTGETGVVIVTSGPGATNVITGVADAMIDSTPMVVVTGQVASPFLGTDAFQEADVVGITSPITKWSYQIRKAEDVPWAVSKAFYIANSGRPGPVVLDFTRDAQVGEIEYDDDNYPKCNFIRSYIPKPIPSAVNIERVADMINNSERPMIISGHGVMISGAEEELRELAEKGDIPVAATLLGLSTMRTDHRLYKGMVGMHGNIAPNVNTNKADLIIAIGMRFDDRVTGNVSGYAKQAKIVHIDIDSSEFDKNIKTDATIHADAKEALQSLLPLIEKREHSEWIAEFDRPAAVERESVIERELFPKSGKMTMGEVINRVIDATEEKAIVVTDVGQNQMFACRYSRFKLPKSLVSSGGLGTMGFGFPAAIGAKIGATDRTVCVFLGDGGLQMTIQELGTIMEYGIDIKIILLNNNFLGNVRQWQSLFWNNRFSQTPMLNPDFVMIAKAYGIAGEDVEDRSQLSEAIERMLEHKGSYLLNVNIDETDMVFPMTPGGANVDHILLNPNDVYSID